MTTPSSLRCVLANLPCGDLAVIPDNRVCGDGPVVEGPSGTDRLREDLTTWVATTGGVDAWRRTCGIKDDTFEVLAPFIDFMAVAQHPAVNAVVTINVPDLAAAAGLGPWWADAGCDPQVVQSVFDAYGDACTETYRNELRARYEMPSRPALVEDVTLQVITYRHHASPVGPPNTPSDDEFAYTTWANTVAVTGPFPVTAITDPAPLTPFSLTPEGHAG